MSADLDKAIDRAVREMLDVEPPADLRAKVIARIDARPASGFQLPALSFQRSAAVAAAAAILILAVAVAHRSAPPPQTPAIAQGDLQRPPIGSLPTAQIAVPSIASQAAPKAQTAVAPVPVRVAYAASADAANAPGIDPLKSIAPIEVAPIAQESVTPEPIGVRPLNPIPEVQVAPLNPPDRRD